MLTLLFTHILISSACLWAGFLFYKYIIRSTEKRSVIFFIISGLILLTTIVQWLVLSFPLNTGMQVIIFAVLLFLAIIRIKDCRQVFAMLYEEIKAMSLLTKSILLVAWVLILMINSGPVLMDDTDSYHIQAIKWIQEYGTVPGIVNLHERFGFSSSWFSSVALFSFSSNSAGSFTALNGVLSLWFSFYLLGTYSRLTKANSLQAGILFFIVLVFAFSIWPMIRGNAASVNYDFITTALVVILFAETFLNNKSESNTRLNVEWIVWPVYLFTIRIINFPLLLLSLSVLLILINKKKFTKILLLVFFSLLLLLPFLGRNILLTGYPFYPSTYFNYFNVDWKTDPAMMDQLLYYIKYYGRVSTTFMDLEQTATFNFPAWIPVWFLHLFSFDKIILVAGSAGLLGSFIWMPLKRNSFNKEVKLFILVLLVWLACWFFISPDPRFVYGALLSGVFLFFYILTSFASINNPLKIVFPILPVLFFIAISIYTILKPIRQPEYRNLISAATLPQPPLKKIMLDRIELYIPEKINNNWNPRCYGSPLPCLYEINPRLKTRGKSIRGGFRLEK